jgi:hypothetical protein
MSVWAITVGKESKLCSFLIVVLKYCIRTIFSISAAKGHHCWALFGGAWRRVRVPVYNLHVDFSIGEGICRAVSQDQISSLKSHMELTFARASYFSYISSTSYVVSFLGPTVASFTMSRNLWLPFWINIVLLACAIPTISLLPGTKDVQVGTITSAEPRSGSTEEAGPLLNERDPSPSRYSNAFEMHPGFFQSVIHAIHRIMRLMSGRRNFQVLLVSFFLTALASSDTKLLVQYISKRYGWTFAQAGYMLSAKAIVNFTLLAIVVPRVIKSTMTSTTVRGSEVRLNYFGAEISILISVVGVLCVALAFRFWMLLAGKSIVTRRRLTLG